MTTAHCSGEAEMETMKPWPAQKSQLAFWLLDEMMKNPNKGIWASAREMNVSVTTMKLTLNVDLLLPLVQEVQGTNFDSQDQPLDKSKEALEQVKASSGAKDVLVLFSCTIPGTSGLHTILKLWWSLDVSPHDTFMPNSVGYVKLLERFTAGKPYVYLTEIHKTIMPDIPPIRTPNIVLTLRKFHKNKTHPLIFQEELEKERKNILNTCTSSQMDLKWIK